MVAATSSVPTSSFFVMTHCCIRVIAVLETVMVMLMAMVQLSWWWLSFTKRIQSAPRSIQGRAVRSHGGQIARGGDGES